MRKTQAKHEDGVVIVLAALLLVPLTIFIVYATSVTQWSALRQGFKNAADAAASDAGSTLCSTRDCWNHSLINAFLAIRNLRLRGRTSRAKFDSELLTAINALNSQLLSGTLYISGPDNKTEWNIDGVRIRIQRGRWWPHAYRKDLHGILTSTLPTTVDTTRLLPRHSIYGYSNNVRIEPKFETFDRLDGSDWQTERGNQGSPNFIAANAVRVELLLQHFSSTLSMGIAPSVQIHAETIVSRNKRFPDLTFCAAPFGIPVCSLITDGDYVPEQACQFDRFFTGVKRYCTDAQLAAGTCEVLPGSWYSPTTTIACDPSASWYNPHQCLCAQAAQRACAPLTSCPESWARGDFTPGGSIAGDKEDVPCGQQFGQNSMACNFYPWPKLNEVSDHFGVVGTSTSSIYSYDPNQENTYQWIMGGRLCIDQVYTSPTVSVLSRKPHAVRMFLGERFMMKETGLELAATDNIVWRAIYGRPGIVSGDDYQRSSPQFFDPNNTLFGPNGQRELGYPYYMGRVDDANGYPFGTTKKFLDALIGLNYIEPYPKYGQNDLITGLPLQTIEPWACNKAGIPQFGACNSHRTWYNNYCQRRGRWFYIDDTNPSPTPVTLSGSGLQAYTTNWVDWSYTYSDEQATNCANLPPYMPCPVPAVGGPYAEGGESAPISFHTKLDDYHPAIIRVLHTKLPVIADMNPDAQPCKGVAGSIAEDPPIDPTHDWRIIGFVRAYLYDNDIGKPPPQPPGPAWDPNPITGNNEPNTCDYGVNRQPWGFNPTYEPPLPSDPSGPPVNAGAPANCNMVRGRVSCSPGIVAGDYSGLFSEPKKTPAIVYTR